MGIIDNAKELADLLKAAGNTELYRKIVELEGEIIELTRQNPNRSPSRLMTRILSSSVSSVARSNHRRQFHHVCEKTFNSLLSKSQMDSPSVFPVREVRSSVLLAFRDPWLCQ